MGLQLVKSHLFLRDFDESAEPYATVRPYTNLPTGRLYALRRLAAETLERQVEGDVVVLGSCCGGAAALLSHTVRTRGHDRVVWLYDSFEGAPKPTRYDGQEAWQQVGDYIGSIDRCREVMQMVGALEADYRIVPGWFERTFAIARHDRIAVMHLDAGLYEATRLALERFYDRVSNGGLIVIEDYHRLAGCQKAVDDFFFLRGESAQLVQIDEQSAYLFKPVSLPQVRAALEY